MQFFRPEIPPARPPSNIFSIIGQFASFRQPSFFLERGGLKKDLGNRQALFYGSAKQALYQLFSLLARGSQRRYVLVSSYTCPDIARAVISAGLKVAVVDVQAESLAMDWSKLPVDLAEDVLAIVLSNLYGVPEPSQPWEELAAGKNILLIDDACQSFFSKENSVNVGLRANSLGLLSLAEVSR